MDTELLVQRSKIIKSLREFFEQENFLEVDTPALSPTLIPETCLEVFKTFYHKPDYQNHPAAAVCFCAELWICGKSWPPMSPGSMRLKVWISR